MKKIIAVATAAIGLLLGSVSPAAADTPNTVREGRSGALEAAWVRAACGTTPDGVKCALRFPDGFSRLDLEYRIGRRLLASETTWTYDRRTHGQRLGVSGKVARGVRISCTAHGNRIACVLRLAPRFRDFNVTTYSAGDNWGGLRGDDVVL